MNWDSLFHFGFWDFFWFFVVLIVSLPWIINEMAENNFIFTKVQEGQAKAILRMGKLHRFVMNYEGHFFDYKWNVWRKDFLTDLVSLKKKKQKSIEVLENQINSPKEIEEEKRRGRIEKVMGVKVENVEERKENLLAWAIETFLALSPILKGIKVVGLYPFYKVFWYKFTWTSFEQQKGGKGELKAVTKEKMIDYIILQDDVYCARVEGAETEDKVPVDVNLSYSIRISNPFKALFLTQKWLEITTNRIVPRFRRFISTFTYDDIHGMKKSGSKTDASKKIIDFLTEDKLDEDLEFRYGVHIVHESVEMQTIDPISESNPLMEAAAKPWVAQKNAEAKKKEAEGKKAAAILEGEGQAKVLEIIAEEAKKQGIDPAVFIGLKTLEETGKLGNVIIIPSQSQGLMLNIPTKKGENQ